MEQLPPPVLDNVIQSLAAVVDDGQTYLPVRFGSLMLFKKPKGATLRSLVRLTPDQDGRPGEMTADMLLLDGDRPVAVVRSLAFRRVANTGSGARRQLLHQPRWLKRSLIRAGGEASTGSWSANRPAARVAALAAAAGQAGTPLPSPRPPASLPTSSPPGPPTCSGSGNAATSR